MATYSQQIITQTEQPLVQNKEAIMDCRKGIVADQKYVLQSQIQSEVINSTTHQRRSANYKPNIWKYDLLQSLTIQYNEEECKRQVEKLKEDVMCMFIEAVDLVAKLEFIDSIEKLGLANLFEVEIKEALDTIVAFKNNHPITEEGIYANALFFRILRQHGFNVSQGFTSKMGTFMKSTNSDDTKAMLELLEASHLALEGENILIEAKEFSAGILKNIINSNVEDKVAKQLAQALELPLQWRAQWYDVKRHIHELENKDNTNSVLLKLAKLNFNMVQATHQNDLKEISRVRRRREKIIKNTPDKDVNDDDFLWVFGNFEDQQAQIPGDKINWNKGEADLNFLKSQYSYPDLNVLRAAFRYPNRGWAELLNFEPTYRYSGHRKTRVTDFLFEPSPEPDPSLPQINLIPLTAEQEMAKKRAVRALLTETNQPEVLPADQTQETVVAFPSHQPSSSRPNKRARTFTTEPRLVDEEDTILPPSPPPSPQPERSDRASSSKWAPKITFQNRAIRDTDSVVVEKDHLMAFNLAKSVYLPPDMEHHDHLTELKALRSSTKSMVLAIQKNHIAHKRVLELRKTTRQAMAKANAKNTVLEESKKKIAELQTEMACLNGLVSSAEANKRKAAAVVKDKYLRELAKLEGKKDAEIKELEKKLEDAENRGYKEGEATWWKNLSLVENLSFARNRLVESYLWAVGVAFEPQHNSFRKWLTKAINFIIIIDDIYDVYGSLEELECFTNSVERWDDKEIQQLPECMKICFQALYNTTNEVAYEIQEEKGWQNSVLPYLHKVKNVSTTPPPLSC
ncbi:hypothetical protein HYC85_017761 [Camellia sinensis]|uniref:Uncharacterized protein n=1 Tax=Camellia sinensis TaxID=4442 RepID=A0A7J7GW52_CAMSI|nr:hypothetical protein HYC85_017761 [Camellia sinensis]